MAWHTWSPLQSPAVKQICAHMTHTEWSTALTRAVGYGVWVAATLALPFNAIVLAWWQHLSPIIIGIAILLILVHICCIPAWLSSQRRFLCSTQWGREQGLRPQDLHLFATPASAR